MPQENTMECDPHLEGAERRWLVQSYQPLLQVPSAHPKPNVALEYHWHRHPKQSRSNWMRTPSGYTNRQRKTDELILSRTRRSRRDSKTTRFSSFE